MKFTKLGRVAAIAAAGALLLSSCAANEGGGDNTDDNGGDETTSLSGTLNGVGASSIGAASEAWVAGFQTANDGVTVNYDAQGSGAGREAFVGGGADFAGSDAVLDAGEESALCSADGYPINLPIYISPIAIVFNLDGIDELNMDAATITQIFKGEITNWNDEAIASQNEGVDLPDQAISPVYRSDDSGTSENLADYLHEVAPDDWTEEPSGTWPWDGGEGAQQTSGVVDAVSNNIGTFGYMDASRADGLGTVALQVGDEYVPYSAEAAAAVVDASPIEEGRPDGDLAVQIDRTTTESGVYPAVLVAYAIACSSYEDAAKGELVQEYLTYITSEDGQQVAEDAAGSAPLSPTLRDQITESISQMAG
ncbi:phosphate ABC transporter substrate-binding protein PstS [uncultured Agrococcus sp.]|uniref:phosphate ABC transporter substrate-binding protein PstS n=1 Tax=uncultured Agrococcus sp. TaxID=382258 RepID=UPI0025F6075A|nr:phosphate ABC transporter substrate-binding protein PstS [uncultured Agrococcus sp.]